MPSLDKIDKIHDPFAIINNGDTLPQEMLSQNLLDVVNLFSRVKKVITVAPTHTPRNLWEQFEILSDGNLKLCVHCGTTWATVNLTII